MSGAGLTRLSLPELWSLHAAIEREELSCPLVSAELHARGCGGEAARDLLTLFAGHARGAVLAILQAVIAERELRPPPHLDLVWTGPETRLGHARDTAVLVRELFEGAQASVLIAGYRFDHGEAILASLHAAMRDRGVRVDVFVDVPDRAPSTDAIAEHVRDSIDGVFGRNWPFGPPWPNVYYDPRTATPGLYVSLHAKCIVVDARRTLVTSANFTDRGQTRNIELGVLVDDPVLGARVCGQFRSLVDAGLLVAVE